MALRCYTPHGGFCRLAVRPLGPREGMKWCPEPPRARRAREARADPFPEPDEELARIAEELGLGDIRGGRASSSKYQGFSQSPASRPQRASHRSRRKSPAAPAAPPNSRVRGPPVRGQDVRATVRLSLMESVTGTPIMVSYTRMCACSTCEGSGAHGPDGMVACSICGGSGRALVYTSRQADSGSPSVGEGREAGEARVPTFQPCPGCGGGGAFIFEDCSSCDGLGLMEEHRSLRVVVPAGVKDSDWVRVGGLGNVGECGGEAGDLFVKCVVGSMEGVKRDGDDLVSELSVPVWSALLGCEAHVETLLGWVRLPVPVGTQHGDELRVRGAGAGIRSKGPKGDHVFLVRVVIPTELTEDQREAVSSLKARMKGGSGRARARGS